MGSTGYWEIRTYECGGLGEKTKYWVPGEPPARGRKLSRSSERKQRQNENDAVRRLNREIHANFSAGDLFLGLDYGPTKYSELLRRAEARQVTAELQARLAQRDDGCRTAACQPGR